MTILVIASGNAGKVREFGALLADLGLDTQPQPEGLEVEETGNSFADNARLKAEAVARATGCWALADDSGLSVEALGGAPGVHSARYADSDSARIERLLRELSDVGASSPTVRSAHFTAALALANPQGEIVLEVEGICPGTILEAPRGSGGFGYDPVFFVPEAELTFAEMPHSQKAALGHRGRAFAALKPRLEALLAEAHGSDGL
ncbi:RdgB/HAM1 family non-canonical purine NTP pyrophosphatase [Synechococcus sp. HJ21-Hayes]|jgi:XTP/dITP diphosphohydrolase|uniref:RdgB/HAM1 family non-canonical purine NTP pyrophosphatase n=1 Tax=unclassified Synechococcus TaxID=2626047 RepID=UPI0020CD0779|nr:MULTISPECIES: RdgB/HAM1 family non-canonical purine NTP pyrophosphatase [unclassified Synechococcus]MCP9830322.1 RdgB/HAM1 family non-canonical purine NTP pyrophosphatase [Synechococcus sp. JJ3a-Johnson]MCP9852953.1 RdgB/HAM1 family non-canonical purine NTP pyrophosphatase [Synechococcus sp. HJ21-Hayes]